MPTNESRKHALRHSRPFRCRQPGCTITIGFCTANDLERHMKSRHLGTLRDSAPSITYRCYVPGCRWKEKSWPRMDNFRSHLKRIHSTVLTTEEDFDTYMNRQVIPPWALSILLCIYLTVLFSGKTVGDNGTMPGNGADLRPLHVLADSAASVR
jgi:hypothetical protein